MPRGVVAEIKSINYHWWNREPEPQPGATHFAGTVQILIGEVGDDRADSFDLIVCSPSTFIPATGTQTTSFRAATSYPSQGSGS